MSCCKDCLFLWEMLSWVWERLIDYRVCVFSRGVTLTVPPDSQENRCIKWISATLEWSGMWEGCIRASFIRILAWIDFSACFICNLLRLTRQSFMFIQAWLEYLARPAWLPRTSWRSLSWTGEMPLKPLSARVPLPIQIMDSKGNSKTFTTYRRQRYIFV